MFPRRGWNPEDSRWLDAVHPDDRDRCVGIYVPAVEARRPFLAEYRLRHTDGSYRWLLATGVPRYEPDGSFSGYIGCDVDITERKTAEDRIRASQAALEASHQEVQYLAGRLIGAQEVERARIARDLHDDVSQQLAGVSIAFSGLKQRTTPIPAGEHQVRMEFAYAGGGLGKGGKVTLYTDGKKVGEGNVDATLTNVFSADDGCDVGEDTGAPVSPDYGPRGNAFNGRVKGVQLAIAEAAEAVDHLVDPEEAVRVALARQ